MQNNIISATIAISASLSGAVYLGSGTLSKIIMPAAWTAANLTFQVSDDNVTYSNLYDASGTEYVVTAAASRAIIVPVSEFQGFRYLKVRSGTAGVAVNQAAARTLSLVAVHLQA